jgi:hypothetical protein
LKDPSKTDLRWKCVADGYWELRPRRGKYVAAIALSDETGRWAWYFALPGDWLNGRAPTGLAGSLESAKHICEAIAASIIEPGDDLT